MKAIFGTTTKLTALKQCLGMAGMICLSQITFASDDILKFDKPAPYEQCGYCHEYDGYSSMEKYPKLNGQKKSYLLKQLQDYRSGRRGGKGMMQTAVSLLTNEDMKVVADYFSRQTPIADSKVSNTSDLEQARLIWGKGIRARQIIACRLCHLSSEPEIPKLLGQHAQYLESQLHAFKNKTRTNDVATIMQFLAERLSDNEITQLSQFLATEVEQ